MPPLFPYAVGNAFPQTQEESGRSPHFSVKFTQRFPIWIPCALCCCRLHARRVCAILLRIPYAPRSRHVVADSVRATFAPCCCRFHARHVRDVLLQISCVPRSRRVVTDSAHVTLPRISDQLIGCHCIAFAVRSMAASSLLRFSFIASAIIISFTFIRRV